MDLVIWPTGPSLDESGHSIGKLLYESLLPWLPDTMIYIQEKLLPQHHQHKVRTHLTIDRSLGLKVVSVSQ